MTKFHRIRQVAEYGWRQANQISNEEFGGNKCIAIFWDILKCYRRFGLWSNQYMKERFWALSNDDRERIGQDYCQINKKREDWIKDFYDNRRFLAKWSKYEIEASPTKREARNNAYKKRYNMGEGCLVEYGVELSRQHYLPGTITIGDNVLLAKHVFIDYSGEVVIKDNVQLTNGTVIETHHHAFHSDPNASRSIVIPTSLLIEEGAIVGSRAIILSSCHYIGKNARVGAGAVVTRDIPDYSIAVGVPAKVIKEMER